MPLSRLTSNCQKLDQGLSATRIVPVSVLIQRVDTKFWWGESHEDGDLSPSPGLAVQSNNWVTVISPLWVCLLICKMMGVNSSFGVNSGRWPINCYDSSLDRHDFCRHTDLNVPILKNLFSKEISFYPGKWKTHISFHPWKVKGK